MNSTLAGVLAAMALAACAGTQPRPESASMPHGLTLMQWTAADNRVAWVVLDSATDVDGVNRQLVRDMPHDIATPARIDRLPLPPFPPPKSALGTSYTATFIVDERGRIERITLTALEDRHYTRKVMTELRQTRFIPALKADGTPTRSVMVLKMNLPRTIP